jgi:hypothetical protein
VQFALPHQVLSKASLAIYIPHFALQMPKDLQKFVSSNPKAQALPPQSAIA